MFLGADGDVFEFYGQTKMKDNPLWINVTELMQIRSGKAIERLVKVPELAPNTCVKSATQGTATGWE